MRKRILIGGLAGCALALSGCGGGSDDGDSNPLPPPPPPPATTYTIGGTVTGLANGATVVLQNNGGGNLSRNANGAFTFANPVNSGATYSVTVATQPTGQVCTVNNGTGTATANVTNVAVACGTSDTTAPTVSARSPLPTAIGAAVSGGVVTVTFSEAMDPASISATTITLTGPSGAVTGTVAIDTNNTRAVFTPSSRLAFETEYTATVTTGAKDAAGNALASAVSWKFNTGKALALGVKFTCLRTTEGNVKCWGDSTYGQLGYGDTTTRGNGAGPGTQTLANVNLGTGRTAVSLVAADYHVCAVLDDASAKCWGRNDFGQLGQGSITGANARIGDAAGEMAALQPINFGEGRKALEIYPGQDFTCARLDNDTVKCFGANDRAQLGRGNLDPLGIAPGDIAAAAPVALGDGLKPVQLSLGHYHACAILEDASANRVAKCWGDNNWGQVGNGNTDRIGNSEEEMGNGRPAIDFGTGRSPVYLMATGGHTCALLDDASTKCWGLNTWGQVGLAAGNASPLDDSEAQRRTCNGGSGVVRPLACIGDQPGEMGNALPAAIAAGQTAKLSIGYRHNCVLRTGNAGLTCWGSNEEGQLGIGSGGVTGLSGSIIGDELNEMGTQPATLVKGRTIEELSAGGFHTCVLYTDLSINCWGHNDRGQLGRNDAEAIVGDSALEMGEALVDINLGS